MSEASTKPYLIRAIHEWCSDNGFTPYLAVAVDQTTQVPREYVRAGEIVLNVSLEATHKLQLGNEYVEFQARFGGQARDIVIPIANVSAIYARENGHGMSFEVGKPLGIVEEGIENTGQDGLRPSSPPAGESATRRGGAARGSAAGPRALASVKPSSAPKPENLGNHEPKRPNARKLKSVSTGDGAGSGAEPAKAQDDERIVSNLPESTSESSQSTPDRLATEAGSAGDRQEPTRTDSAPRPVAQPKKKSNDEPTDPTPDPTKPTSGKPTLTRVK